MTETLKFNEGKRWGGADWADQQRDIMLIGVGGIGSWLALSLSRIGHSLYLIDGDVVDETNVTGGQMYKMSDVGDNKVNSVFNICREMGCIAPITPISNMFTATTGMINICITALDNMEARKLAFTIWLEEINYSLGGKHLDDCLFMDGRLLLENMEILTIHANNPEQVEKYKKEYLFSDEEVEELDCTTKQSTFGAMTIAGLMTATLCNWLTNRKLDMEFRAVPFYQRLYMPLFSNKIINIEQHAKEGISV